MKTLAWICGKIALVSAIVIGVCCVVLVVPCLFGLRPYTILSGSMEPEIPVASLAYINTKDTEPEIGKVVAFRMQMPGSDVFVCHRIVNQKEKGYVTKGDNNDIEDLVLLKPENIIGSYAYNIPFAGYLFTNAPIALIAIVSWLAGWNLIAFLLEIATKE